MDNLFWYRLGQKRGGGTGGGGGDTPPADNYTWEGVAYHINKGTYRDVYAIGDSVPLDLGSEGVINMQVAAFDTDTLADGSGTAAISWVGKELLTSLHNMNPTLASETGNAEGSGAVGGWEKCSMRAYLQNTIKPMISTNAANLLVSVIKQQDAYDTSAKSFMQTTVDDVWLPSSVEVYNDDGYYRALFSDQPSYTKYTASGVLTRWFNRDAYNVNTFRVIRESGFLEYVGSKFEYGICLGFCTGKSK